MVSRPRSYITNVIHAVRSGPTDARRPIVALEYTDRARQEAPA
jgi:hypothetical protein